MYKTILIPTDGTEFCEKAVKHGVALAKLAGAKVVGVTVSVPLKRAVAAGLSEDILQNIEKSNVTATKKALGAIEAAAKSAGVPVSTMVIKDELPYEGIISAAKEVSADLIVMASHGRRGLSAVILGSETHKVVTHTDIPVLIYR